MLVELKARFDEKNNIAWATRLESAGVHVVYGLVNLKVHCKLCLVVRQESGGIRRYAHVATGNYNRATSRRLHRPGPVHRRPGHRRRRQRGVQLPDRLFEQAQLPGAAGRAGRPAHGHPGARSSARWSTRAAGRPARIIIKNNAVADLPMIRTLYKASQAGVPIDLIVRGVCCLRPGVPGISDHIRVRSIVGRLLEHSRLYYFENGGEPRALHRQRRPDGAQPRPPRRGAGARSPIRRCARTCARWCSRRCSPTPRGPGCSPRAAATSAPPCPRHAGPRRAEGAARALRRGAGEGRGGGLGR